MRARVRPGSSVGGQLSVPGDKSISHRWLLLAATASGRSELSGLPASLDVRSTASAALALLPDPQVELDAWIHMKRRNEAEVEGEPASSAGRRVAIAAAGRAALRHPQAEIDCGNSGTSMRLLAGILAACPFRTVLTGDASLLRRPMERVAEPLRRMGAEVGTVSGRPPLVIGGGGLTGIRYALPVPSAQVKSAILLAGLAAEGETTVVESTRTRDHTERALEHLGAPVHDAAEGGVGRVVTVRRFQHEGFAGTVPGDPSAAAFLAAAAILTHAEVSVAEVGLNPTRTRFLDVLRRMGAEAESGVVRSEVGEPVGELGVAAGAGLHGATVTADELPGVIDEVPVLALVAAHAGGESRFEGGGELRVKESDRLGGLAQGIRELGGEAELRGDTLVVAGGGLRGGTTDARGDHRLAMAFVVGALAARGPCEITGVEWADVSFPGFLQTLRALGATVEVGP